MNPDPGRGPKAGRDHSVQTPRPPPAAPGRGAAAAPVLGALAGLLAAAVALGVAELVAALVGPRPRRSSRSATPSSP